MGTQAWKGRGKGGRHCDDQVLVNGRNLPFDLAENAESHFWTKLGAREALSKHS